MSNLMAAWRALILANEGCVGVAPCVRANTPARVRQQLPPSTFSVMTSWRFRKCPVVSRTLSSSVAPGDHGRWNVLGYLADSAMMDSYLSWENGSGTNVVVSG